MDFPHKPLKTPQKHTETLLTNTMDPNWNPIQSHSISKGFPGNPCGLPSKAQSNVAQTFLSLFFAIPKTYGQPHQNLNRSHWMLNNPHKNLNNPATIPNMGQTLQQTQEKLLPESQKWWNQPANPFNNSYLCQPPLSFCVWAWCCLWSKMPFLETNQWEAPTDLSIQRTNTCKYP